MNNPLDLFAWKLRSERKRQHLTQKALAERLHMSVRTIIEIEKCKSNPKFETVALLAKRIENQPGCRNLPRHGDRDRLKNGR